MSSKMPLDLNGEWVLVKNNEMERYFSEFGQFGLYTFKFFNFDKTIFNAVCKADSKSDPLKTYFRCSVHPARDDAADEPGAEDIARRGEVADRDEVVDAQQKDAIHTRPRVL